MRAWLAALALCSLSLLLVVELPCTGQRAPPHPAPPTRDRVGSGGDSTQPKMSSKMSMVHDGEMVLVPGGTFVMGADDQTALERPAHTVTVAAFLIDKHEVTVGQFRAFVTATGYQTDAERERFGFADLASRPQIQAMRSKSLGIDWSNVRTFSFGYQQRDDEPVVYVSWNDATAFAKWAGKRLPTEAEWEFAAIGNTGRRYVWGDHMPPKQPVGNFLDAAARRAGLQPSDAANGYEDIYVPDYDDGFAYTSPVGSYPAGVSVYGCYDMAGNVWEWCADEFALYGQGTSYRHRVIRGGAWDDGPGRLYGAHRNYTVEYDRHHCLGFRCAADVTRQADRPSLPDKRL
jgi:formylglycine-generating enzyme